MTLMYQNGYKVLDDFTRQLTVVNDLAERGIHLATDFVNRVQSEEQRDALFQIVEFFWSKVENSTKLSKRVSNLVKFILISEPPPPPCG